MKITVIGSPIRPTIEMVKAGEVFKFQDDPRYLMRIPTHSASMLMLDAVNLTTGTTLRWSYAEVSNREVTIFKIQELILTIHV